MKSKVNFLLDVIALVALIILTIGFVIFLIAAVVLVSSVTGVNWWDWVAVGFLIAFIAWRAIRWDWLYFETEQE